MQERLIESFFLKKVNNEHIQEVHWILNLKIKIISYLDIYAMKLQNNTYK